MEEEVVKKYVKAGSIAKRAREFGLSMIKEGASYLDIVSKIEEKIFSLGGKLAFPINFSVNETAAHDTPVTGDMRVLKPGDLVKIDVGVHVDGYIADTAATREVSTKKWRDLIRATEDAVFAALEIVKPGVELRELGEVIEIEIKKFGFHPIVNLSGHALARYDLHAGFTVPNFDNSSNYRIERGAALAIEPFACNGVGKVVEARHSTIFKLERTRGARLPVEKELVKHIEEEYKGLPFSRRVLEARFKRNLGFVLARLVQKGVLKNYSTLREASGAFVSQTEHSALVLDETIVFTR